MSRHAARRGAIVIAVGILFLPGFASRPALAADLDPELVGRWPGFAEAPVAIAVEGAYAYCVFQRSGLGIFDVSRPATPALAGSFRSRQAQDIVVQSGQAYLLDYLEGLLIIDVSDPRHPRRINGYNPDLAMDRRGRSVFVTGGHAYVASLSSGVQVVDVSDPAEPRLVGSFREVTSPVDVFVAGDLAYVAELTFGLLIFDVTDPASPRKLGGFSPDTGFFHQTQSVFVSGNLAYVDDQTGVYVVDVSDPASPRELSKLPPSAPFPETFGEVAGTRPSIFVSGHLAYCPQGDGLVVYDLSDPAVPRQIGSLDGVSAGPIHVSGDHAYLGAAHDPSGQVGLQVIDVRDPALPRRAGAAVTQGFARDVVVVGNQAYVVDGSGLLVLDVTDPRGPELVTTMAQPGAIAIAASPDHVYVAAGESGLVVFDIGSPRDPRLAGSYRTIGSIRRVVVSGARAHVAVELEEDPSWLEILDVSDPARPVRRGRYSTLGSAIELAASGDRFFVSDRQGLHIVDSSDPATPARLGGWEGVDYFAVAGDRAHVTSANDPGRLDGLLVLDVSDPVRPRPLGEPSHSAPGRVWVDGGRALVAAGSYLELVDVSHPALPERVARYAIQSPYGVEGLFVSGGLAYVAAGELLILDIDRRANPERLGVDRSSRFANGVFSSGSHAYVAADDEGLLVLDVSDRRNPQPVGRYSGAPFRKGTTDSAVRVFVSGSHAFVTVNTFGLAVFDVSDPASPRLAGTWRLPGRGAVDGIIVADGHAYVRDQGWSDSPPAALQVIDVSRPDRPELVGRYEGRVGPDFSISGGHAFVAAWRDPGQQGLEILDLSDPRNPRRVASLPVSISSVQVSNGYAYATAESNGSRMLAVIDVSRLDDPRLVGAYHPESGFLEAHFVSGKHAYLTSFRTGLEVLDVSDPEELRPVGRSSAEVLDARQLVGTGGAVFVANGSGGLLVFEELHDAIGPSSFRRGDSNGDGETNLADAVFTLNHLFRGGPEPGCLEAADSDDNSAIDLTDPVRLLNHLFQGGPAPAVPGPVDCGEDPAGSQDVGCRGYTKC